MKEYKIPVPEMDKIELDNENALTLNEAYALIHREHIHELVKTHSEKLQYEICDDGYTYNSNEPYIIFYGDATVYTEHNETVFNDCKFQEISWQLFLKLTPEDVLPDEIQEGINIMKNDMFRKCVGHSHKRIGTTTDHNKQALLEAFTAGWDAAHNNRFSIGVNFDKWYHEKAETIKNLRGKYKNYLNPTTTDRNEKAWELFKILMANRYDDNIDFLIELSKTATDEFLKEVGNK